MKIGSSTTWTDVASGHDTTCALQSTALWCWRYNADGELGQNNATRQTSPLQVGTGTNWTKPPELGTERTYAIG